MIVGQAVAVGSGQRLKVAFGMVAPSILRACERRVERTRVADPEATSELPDVICLYSLYKSAHEPDRLHLALLGQFPEGLTVLARGLLVDLPRLLEVWVV